MPPEACLLLHKPARCRLLCTCSQPRVAVHLCPPCPAGIYDPAFIAANQAERADNVIKGSKAQQMETVRQQIRQFKQDQGVDKVRGACGWSSRERGTLPRRGVAWWL